MYKKSIGTIKIPQTVVDQIANWYLPEIESWVSDYLESVYDEDAAEEYGPEDTEEHYPDFDKYSLGQYVEEAIREGYAGVHKMPHIDLKNSGAETILSRTTIELSHTADQKGSVMPLTPTTVEMKLNPVAILEGCDLDPDLDYIMRQFKADFKDTIRHEIIHAVHFAYEHAPLLKHITEPEQDEDAEDDYDNSYSDEDEEEESRSTYKQHTYTNPRTNKQVPLPWDTENNVKVNKPKTNYFNNRYELETWPANLASHVLRGIKKDLRSETDAEKAEHVTELLSDQSQLGKEIKNYEYGLLSGKGRVIQQISPKNKKLFYTKTLKQLTHLLTEYKNSLQK